MDVYCYYKISGTYFSGSVVANLVKGSTMINKDTNMESLILSNYDTDLYIDALLGDGDVVTISLVDHMSDNIREISKLFDVIETWVANG